MKGVCAAITVYALQRVVREDAQNTPLYKQNHTPKIAAFRHLRNDETSRPHVVDKNAGVGAIFDFV